MANNVDSMEQQGVCFRIGDNNAKAFKELDAVGVISENILPLDALNNDIMKSPRCIDSRFTWHVSLILAADGQCC